ncbi:MULTISPECIES: MFS transporter [unclassified Saccharothrix]|uniref:MFS transporter n=1 Tax=unclassified Saccharothrix TaxID=2593673 RepID=UPI00307DD50A
MSATAQPSTDTRLVRPPVVVGVLITAAVLAIAQLYLTVPLLPGIAARHSVSLTTAAWVGGGFGFAFALGNLFFGTASDRYDRRHVMAVGLTLGAVTCVVAGAADSFGPLLTARVAEGFLAAAVPAVSLAYTAEVLPPARRAVGVTAVSSSFLLAGLVGQAYALGVDRAAGPRWVFWLLVPLLLATAFALTRLPAVPRRTGAPWRAFGRLLRTPALLIAYPGALTLLLTFVGMYTALSATVGERYGIHDAGTLLLLRLPGLPGIVLGAFAGPLIARHGPHRVAVSALLTAALGLGVEAVAGGIAGVLVGSAVFVAGLAVAIPALVAVVGQASGEARGAGLAGYAFLVGLGGGISPVLVAALLPAGFAVVCAVLAAVLVVAATVLVWGAKRA